MNIPLGQILKGNCIEVMKQIPDTSVDMVFADPPISVYPENSEHLSGKLKKSPIVDSWNLDALTNYDQFTRDWLFEIKRVLKDTGSLWVIGSYHNIHRIGAVLQDLGFWLLNDIVWHKTNPAPNFRGSRFTNAHELLIWCSKGPKSKNKFNYKTMKSLNEERQMRSDWSLPICTGTERVKNEDGTNAYPTQKPEALLYRAILASTELEDVILDPFFGSGTTGVVAKKLGRNWIGIESENNFVALAKQRLDKVEELKDLEEISTPTTAKYPRIAFGRLVEQGILKPGTVLYGPKKSCEAKIRTDGSLISSNIEGSIHHVAAQLEGTVACNGWTFWNAIIQGELISIDKLRQRLRSELWNQENLPRMDKEAQIKSTSLAREDDSKESGSRFVRPDLLKSKKLDVEAFIDKNGLIDLKSSANELLIHADKLSPAILKVLEELGQQLEELRASIEENNSLFSEDSRAQILVEIDTVLIDDSAPYRDFNKIVKLRQLLSKIVLGAATGAAAGIIAHYIISHMDRIISVIDKLFMLL